MAKKRPGDAALVELRTFGLAYPGAHTKSPWPGHLDLAVNDKTFAYLSIEGEPFSISCKLPRSSHVALMLPFCTPTGYGLGKSGWVSATPPADQPVPVELFMEWIDESYRAQAPKKLVAQLGGAPATPRATSRATSRPAGRPAAAKSPKRATKPAKRATKPVTRATTKTARTKRKSR